MAGSPQTIAIAGVGDLAKYICDALLQSPAEFSVIALSRNDTHPWCESRSIPVHKTDYTVPSLLSILNNTRATAVISFLNIPDPSYLSTHNALLTACTQSISCKRLIPSEWAGDIESYPLSPPFYANTRAPFREVLRKQTEVEWTLVNIGWLADYFLQQKQTWMKKGGGTELFVVDVDGWKAEVRGTGEEGQSWTAAADAAVAVRALLKAGKWEEYTYMTGEWSTFNDAIKVVERFYGRPLPRSQKTLEQIQQAIEGKDILSEESMVGQLEEIMVKSHLLNPKEKTLRQREQYFKGVKFRSLAELLQDSKEMPPLS